MNSTFELEQKGDKRASQRAVVLSWRHHAFKEADAYFSSYFAKFFLFTVMKKIKVKAWICKSHLHSQPSFSRGVSSTQARCPRTFWNCGHLIIIVAWRFYPSQLRGILWTGLTTGYVLYHFVCWCPWFDLCYCFSRDGLRLTTRLLSLWNVGGWYLCCCLLFCWCWSRCFYPHLVASCQ